MKPIPLKDAISRTWDVVLVGTGFAAFFFAHALKGRGLSVLFVERGPFIDRDTQLRNRHKPARYTKIAQENRSEIAKDWIVLHQFGGCSNCWWGNTPRFHPNDFQLKTKYGRGQDWPIAYSDLEPYYARAESIMDVAGGGSDDFLPRSAPYTSKGHVLTRAERRLRAHDNRWVPMPTARSNGETRTQCCTSGTCKLCPVDAKFTILNALPQISGKGYHYVTGLDCRRLMMHGGRCSGVVARAQDGRDVEIKAGVVGLAANAISNSAILLRSGHRPSLVGAGIHEQASQYVWIDIPFDNYYGGTSTTGAGYVEYDGEFRSQAASIFIESWNAPPSLRLERDKWLQRLKLKFIAEDLPKSDNRVVLQNDEAKVIWTGHSAYAYAGLKRMHERLPKALPFAHQVTRVGKFEPTESHIQGGTPMGAGREGSVVDSFNRLFDMQNVYCLGAGVFPSCAAANPTLTLSALSLRAGGNL
ncbi:MAG: GMC family oxidoreductase [Alphaproteobacteria bacterium]|nr:GMC family oxidoreductase [Alphaproteobacteria bacterium]